MNYPDLLNSLHPDFFSKDYIRTLPAEHIFSEQILDLRSASPEAVEVSCPEHITFGFAKNLLAAIHEAVGQVDPDWVQYFHEGSPVFCAFDGGRIVSFCCLDDMGWHHGLHISGPGCVGTIPSYRGQGIGLKMVQKATALLKQQGFDLSYIHYTHLDGWYAKLGYETILRWNCKGILWEKTRDTAL